MKYWILVIKIHNDFILNSFKLMMPFLKGIHNGQELFIMNLVINLSKRKFTIMETN